MVSNALCFILMGLCVVLGVIAGRLYEMCKKRPVAGSIEVFQDECGNESYTALKSNVDFYSVPKGTKFIFEMGDITVFSQE